MSLRHLSITTHALPLSRPFVIARGDRTHVHAIRVSIHEGGHFGRAESVPYVRFGESLNEVVAQIEAIRPHIELGLTSSDLQLLLPPGAARNALDCALWDLAAKQQGLTNLLPASFYKPAPIPTAFTISLGTPEAMYQSAQQALQEGWRLLKLKLGGTQEDPARLSAVRAAAPDANLIVDANESWQPKLLPELFELCASQRVALIEQPLPASQDEILAHIPHPVPLCADESLHTCKDLPRLKGLYEAVNIKLDKTGGLTEALSLLEQARAQGLQTMIGCMLASSLAMAPAFWLGTGSDYVDLDGPLFLGEDASPPLIYKDGMIYPPASALWG